MMLVVGVVVALAVLSLCTIPDATHIDRFVSVASSVCHLCLAYYTNCIRVIAVHPATNCKQSAHTSSRLTFLLRLATWYTRAKNRFLVTINLTNSVAFTSNAKHSRAEIGLRANARVIHVNISAQFVHGMQMIRIVSAAYFEHSEAMFNETFVCNAFCFG